MKHPPGVLITLLTIVMALALVGWTHGKVVTIGCAGTGWIFTSSCNSQYVGTLD